MTEEGKTQLETLELNKETLQELTELETDEVKGGAFRGSDACDGLPSWKPTCPR